MRKVFSYFVLALCLIVSTQVKAALSPSNNGSAVAEVTIGSTTQYADALEEAFEAVTANQGTVAEIKMLLSPEKIVNKSIILKNQVEIEWDLNGQTVTFSAGHFLIDNAKLTIKGTTGGNFNYEQGNGGSYRFLQMMGSDDPQAKEYSVLTVEKDVNVNMYGYFLQVDYGATTQWYDSKYIYGTEVVTTPDNKNNKGAAYGVEAHIWGYINSTYGITVNGGIVQTQGNVPVIYLHPGATLLGLIYCAGYANYTVEGATVLQNSNDDVAIYIKGGSVTLKDATIIATGPYKTPEPDGSGCKGSGTAIVIDSHTGYSAKMELSISGNSTISSTAGYALEETATKGEDKLAKLSITGGNFVGHGEGANACFMTTDAYKTYIVDNNSITGGIFNDDIENFVNAANTVLTYTDSEDGQKWTLGAKPADEWKNTIASAGEGDYVQLNSAAPITETINADKKIAYLAILNSNKVVVEGATLRVGEIVINEDAQLVIKADAKVIVEEKQGIISTANENLIIEADAQSNGQLLINPLVTFNTTPRATVELTTRSFVDAPAYLYERVAIPFGFVVDELSCEGNVETYFEKYNYDTESWQELGFLNRDVTNPNHKQDLNVADLNDPFVNYQFLTYNQTPGVKYTFKGKLVGNTSKEMPLRANFWNGFGNSYVAEMDVKTLLDAIEEQFSGSTTNLAIYYYKCVNEQKQVYEWKPVSEMNLDSKIKLRPMEVFLIKNDGGEMTLPIDYKTMIWDTKAE